MRFLKTIKLFYIMYTIYTILVLLVSDYQITYALLGLTGMWLTYAFFWLGSCSVNSLHTYYAQGEDEKNMFPFAKIAEWKNWQYILNAIVCWICAILSARYYTGQNFLSVIAGVISGGAVYREYQSYFANAGLATFTFAKIPYILMLTFVISMLFFGMIGITQSGKKIKFLQVLYLISVCLSQLYFGAARGTNFETYTVFILLAFCFLNRSEGGKERRLNYKAIAIVFILGLIMVFIYRTVISNRGVEFNNSICPEISYQSDRFLSIIFPTMTNIVLSVFSYLGYGIYEIGVTFYEIILQSPFSMLMGCIPTGFDLAYGQSLPLLLGDTIDLGARWVPDFVFLLNGLGMFFYYGVILIVGCYVARIRTKGYPKLLVDLIYAIVFVEMLSIPVGNFLTASTPNELFVLAVILWYLKCRLNIRLFNNEKLKKIRWR